jgi:hypothetical protein
VNSLLTGNFTGNFSIFGLCERNTEQETAVPQGYVRQFPAQINGILASQKSAVNKLPRVPPPSLGGSIA